MYFIFTKT
ncbi:hypothetical protein JI435_419420 [Parastagonospora nodorum SN15]|uniref:Uncharacterized protein n=1 Tax=Phaeosphaeria nodorum (strain SN15 / ATCC MYA-4574 / FGSC 10173) TaxID=321614 RepID=A0A7U2I6D3_PHANO|nr:hypothetical protein JI435_419420 [Parastagonospora nodorum SN15]QRD03379.1 hypothetical protein JI435_419420 [Parastagonospora nodorum SN15]